MPRCTGSLDVYDKLADERSRDWIMGLLTFAVVEEQKFEWMRHHAEYEGRDATDEEIRAWYGSLPVGAVVRARGIAENALGSYAEEVEASFSDSVREELKCSALIGEIRQVRRFWPQFALSVAAGLTSSILFAALLFTTAFLVLNDRSPVELGARIISSTTQGSTDDHK
ncbi:hypothetical protein EGJ34_19470 [Stenotrophomonas sp. 278]|nr:hypothetical protein EGJ34_19470 [Stenotrophomonas sp. 278]